MVAGGKPAQRVRNFLCDDPARLGDIFPRDQIRQRRTRRDRSHAALGLESRFHNPAVFDAHRQFHRVAANGIRDFRDSGGARKISGVVWISEVLEYRLVQHGLKYAQD